jgi:ribonuclease P protein component
VAPSPTPVRLVRLKRRADFERVLGAGGPAIVARSPHFVLHHLRETSQLSTGLALETDTLVDGSVAPSLWLAVGVVIPKRWARRSVTRNVLKRQMYAAFARYQHLLPGGMWVARLRSSFERSRFPSADSPALRQAARVEIEALMTSAAQRLAPGGRA